MLATSEYSPEFYQGLSRKQAGAMIDKAFKQPPVAWILRKLNGMHIGTVPKTNGEGLNLLKQGRRP